MVKVMEIDMIDLSMHGERENSLLPVLANGELDRQKLANGELD